MHCDSDDVKNVKKFRSFARWSLQLLYKPLSRKERILTKHCFNFVRSVKKIAGVVVKSTVLGFGFAEFRMILDGCMECFIGGDSWSFSWVKWLRNCWNFVTRRYNRGELSKHAEMSLQSFLIRHWKVKDNGGVKRAWVIGDTAENLVNIMEECIARLSFKPLRTKLSFYTWVVEKQKKLAWSNLRWAPIHCKIGDILDPMPYLRCCTNQIRHNERNSFRFSG